MSTKEKYATRQEVALLQSLQHPNIVGYKDSFMTNNDKELCIVMTYCEGGDLANRIKDYKGSRLPEKLIMQWFSQILLAVDFLHSRKVLHRDLKSQNIFLTKDGTVKLGDFGIARVFERTLDMAKTSIGTPLYMSPEVCNSRPYNYKSDIWSLGCILYEMCARRPPFNANDLKGLFMKIIGGVYTPIPHTYSTKLQELVRKTLYTNPHRRPSISQILKSSYVKECATEYIRSVLHQAPSDFGGNLNQTMTMLRKETSNIKIQANELGYNLDEIYKPSSSSTDDSSQESKQNSQISQKQRPPPNSSQLSHGSQASHVSHVSNISYIPQSNINAQPKKEIILNKRKIPISDVQRAVQKLDKMEEEKRHVKEKLEMLRNKRQDNLNNLANENEKRRAALSLKKHEQEDAILEKQRKKQRAAEERRLRIKQGLAMVPKYGRLPSQKIPSQKPPQQSRDIAPQIESLQSRKDDHKDRITKIQESKQELYQYVEKKIQLEKQIQSIEQNLHIANSKGMFGGNDDYREHIKQMAQQDYIAPNPDFSGLSHKDKILKMKELKRQAEDQEVLNMLQKARNEYVPNRMRARNMEYNQYHGSSPPKRHSIVDNGQSLQNLLPKQDRYSENEKFIQLQEDKRRVQDESQEDLQEDSNIEDLEKMYTAKKQQINELRKTLTQAYGKSLVELKKLAASNIVEEDGSQEDDLESDDESEDSEEEETEMQSGRLEDRVIEQRRRCIKFLGETNFKKLYRAYKDGIVPNDERSCQEFVTRLIGHYKPEYVDLMEELLFTEENIYPNQ